MAAVTIQQVEQNLAAMPEEQRAVAEEAMSMLSDEQLQSVLNVFDVQLTMEQAPQPEVCPAHHRGAAAQGCALPSKHLRPRDMQVRLQWTGIHHPCSRRHLRRPHHDHPRPPRYHEAIRPSCQQDLQESFKEQPHGRN